MPTSQTPPLPRPHLRVVVHAAVQHPELLATAATATAAAAAAPACAFPGRRCALRLRSAVPAAACTGAGTKLRARRRRRKRVAHVDRRGALAQHVCQAVGGAGDVEAVKRVVVLVVVLPVLVALPLRRGGGVRQAVWTERVIVLPALSLHSHCWGEGHRRRPGGQAAVWKGCVRSYCASSSLSHCGVRGQRDARGRRSAAQLALCHGTLPLDLSCTIAPAPRPKAHMHAPVKTFGQRAHICPPCFAPRCQRAHICPPSFAPRCQRAHICPPCFAPRCQPARSPARQHTCIASAAARVAARASASMLPSTRATPLCTEA
eukprot:364287-Chlamydomonas_euryale.AAC.1